MQTVEFEAEIKNGQLTIPVELLAQLQPYKETEAVHITHNKIPCYVLLSEEIYQNLMIKQNNAPKKSAWELLLNKPFAGIRTKTEIDLQLKAERESWGDK